MLIVAACFLLFLVTAQSCFRWQCSLRLFTADIAWSASFIGSVFVRRWPVEHALPGRIAIAVRSSPPRAVKRAAVPALSIKPLAVRVTDLIGSLLVAAAVTAAMCVVMLLIESYRGISPQIEQCAWLYLVSLAGAWLVLVAAKFWERSQGERMLRHFVLMTVGFGLGLLAFGVADVFWSGCPMTTI